MAPIIHVENLVKEFRRPRKHEGFLGGARTLFTRQYDVTRAVDGIDFDIAAGELVGYIGPNGAGKSTTIKMMTGILVPTSGDVVVSGLVPWRERERNALQIGVVFGQRSQLWWDLPLIESFKLIGKLYRVSDATYRRNLDRFISLLEMDEFIGKPVRQLSLGQRMRGDLAAAMLYEPRLLYLDEPTVGLDVVAKERMRLFIEEMNRDAGTTIVLTTHDLADVERLCRRIILIDHGHVLYDGGVEQLKAKYAPYRVLVVELAPEGLTGATQAGLDASGLPGVAHVEHDDATLRISFETATVRVQDLIAAVNARYAVADLRIVEPDLEGVVREIYGTQATAP
ncbi:MAG: ABC transporter ATP-binding protein [Acidothermaceae bacterium]